MAATQWATTTPIDPRVAASALVTRLDEGDPLPVIGDPLDAGGEMLHADVWVNAAWYGPTDVFYDDVEYVDFGGWLGLAASVTASAVGRRRRREAAARLAVPQWRVLGDAPVRALLTDRRLLLQHDDGVVDLRHDEVEVVADLGAGQVDLWAIGAAPLALEGPWVPYLTVALVYSVAGVVVPRSALTAASGSGLRFSRHP